HAPYTNRPETLVCEDSIAALGGHGNFPRGSAFSTMPQPSSRVLVGRRCKHLIGKRISRNRPNGCNERNESEESRLSTPQTFMASREISLSVPRTARCGPWATIATQSACSFAKK